MIAQGQSFPDLVVVKTGEAQESFPEAGLVRKVLAYNDKLFLVEHRMRKGWAGALHSHPHEQIAYVVSGRLTVTCLGKSIEVRAGDSFLVRGGVQHAASALEDSVVVDVFTPCRRDYIPVTSK
jgi:quercetin dioxygenase-like cupin family protein